MKNSKADVNKAGDFFKSPECFSNSTEFNKNFEVLSDWRFKHSKPLEDAFALLQTVALQKDKKAIFAKRLKRLPSILLKLQRFPKMMLKNIQDIGGCRVVVKNKKIVRQVVKELKKDSHFCSSKGEAKEKNYIDFPKPDGYRSYHLIGKFLDPEGFERRIEIQVRTVIQHDWATALEIVDIFTDQALKTNQGSKQWRDFFRLVSEHFNAMESIVNFQTLTLSAKENKYNEHVRRDKTLSESRNAIAQIARDLDVYDKFNAFMNSVKIVDDRLKQNKDDEYSGFVLLEIDTTKKQVKTALIPQENFDSAKNLYMDSEKRAQKKGGLVVALVSAGHVGDIQTAYPNYFADSKDFMVYLSFIIPPKNIQKSRLGKILSRL